MDRPPLVPPDSRLRELLEEVELELRRCRHFAGDVEPREKEYFHLYMAARQTLRCAIDTFWVTISIHEKEIG